MLIHFAIIFKNPDKSVNLTTELPPRSVLIPHVFLVEKMNIHISCSLCFLSAVATLSDITINVTQLIFF